MSSIHFHIPIHLNVNFCPNKSKKCIVRNLVSPNITFLVHKIEGKESLGKAVITLFPKLFYNNIRLKKCVFYRELSSFL